MGARTDAGRRGVGRRVVAEMNVTPLVDVMLVLLIVFMVAAPLMTTGLPIELPRVSAEGAPVADTELRPVVVDVTRAGALHLDGARIDGDLAGLGPALVGHEGLRAGATLHVRGDRFVEYGVVADVVAAARGAGITAVNLVVEPRPVGGDG